MNMDDEIEKSYGSKGIDELFQSVRSFALPERFIDLARDMFCRLVVGLVQSC